MANGEFRIANVSLPRVDQGRGEWLEPTPKAFHNIAQGQRRSRATLGIGCDDKPANPERRRAGSSVGRRGRQDPVFCIIGN